MRYGWIPVTEVLEVLKARDPDLHVIITGRNAPAELVEYADLVTEMKAVKHPYKEGDQGPAWHRILGWALVPSRLRKEDRRVRPSREATLTSHLKGDEGP